MRVMAAMRLETLHRAAVQRRTVRTLFASQVLGGLGLASGIAVGGLLAEDVGGTATLAGLAQTASVLGAALFAVPLARLMGARGRRPGLVTGYAVGALGAVVTVTAAVQSSFPRLLLGLLLFGAANAASLQARYAATDLAEPARRGRSLAVIVWASTLGTVMGPNLIEPGSRVARWFGLPSLAGPFLFAVTAFVAALLLIGALLRPDPLLLARGPTDPSAHAPRPARIATSLGIVRASRPALLGLVAVAVAHTVMVSVMVMTPVHMHDGGAALRVIGLVISGHVAGMYALSPLVGFLADALGRVPVIVIGVAVLAVALFLAGTAPAGQSAGLAVGLFLLGVGWSCGLVAGSTLLSESVPEPDRPAVQGAADLVMGLCGAAGGAVGGLVVGTFGFDILALVASPLLVIVAAMALTTRAPAGLARAAPVIRDELAG